MEIYSASATKKELCYLDNAATTFPKPREVVLETMRCMQKYCGNPGRGSHFLARAAADKLYEARELASQLFGLSDPAGVVLTMNATHALNLAIFTAVPEGSHVLLCDLAHNSTLRPLEHLKRTKGIEYTVFSHMGNVMENIENAVRSNTTALICTHASNITNSLLPLEKIGRYLSKRGICFIVDASQSAGAHKINMEEWEISALCMPGHKGLCGPQGTGLALFSSHTLPSPLLYGGSGSDSLLLGMPDALPERLEAGTMATPSVAGLVEGMKYVIKRGEENIFLSEVAVIEKIKAAFENDERIEVYSRGCGSIWLFNIKGKSPQSVSQSLDKMGICTRAGLHCAPLAHKTMKTPAGGAVRVSAGPMNTLKDSEKFIKALKKLLGENAQ